MLRHRGVRQSIIGVKASALRHTWPILSIAVSKKCHETGGPLPGLYGLNLELQ